jgi:hypothetical protein
MTNPVPEMAKYPHDMPVVLTYGGGTNSSAILVELIKRGYPAPDLIVFADTGAEMPHTYEHIKIMSAYAVKHGYPAITIIRSHQKSKAGGLYAMSVRNRKLPAVAYSDKSCSKQFKIEPVDLFVAMSLGHGIEYLCIVGFDFGETHRALAGQAKNDILHKKNWFPLIEWEMYREDCIKSLEDERLPLAGKSSCFMCPNMRPHEIKKLAAEYPDLIAKAVRLEELVEERNREEGMTNAPVRGLGRTWRWKDLIATDDMFGFVDVDKPMPCGCYDGDEDD